MKYLAISALFLGFSAPLPAHEYTLGSLVIDHPAIRVASAVSKTGAGYMTITNRGKTADRLLSVATAASNRSDLHGTVQTGNVMQMRSATEGVPVPAGAAVRFAPGGLHVMFIGLKRPLPEGQAIKARLLFEKAGTVEVEFKAELAANHVH